MPGSRGDTTSATTGPTARTDPGAGRGRPAGSSRRSRGTGWSGYPDPSGERSWWRQVRLHRVHLVPAVVGVVAVRAHGDDLLAFDGILDGAPRQRRILVDRAVLRRRSEAVVRRV